MIDAVKLLRGQASSARETADLHEKNLRSVMSDIKALRERSQATERVIKKYRDEANAWETAASILEDAL